MRKLGIAAALMTICLLAIGCGLEEDAEEPCLDAADEAALARAPRAGAECARGKNDTPVDCTVVLQCDDIGINSGESLKATCERLCGQMSKDFFPEAEACSLCGQRFTYQIPCDWCEGVSG